LLQLLEATPPDSPKYVPAVQGLQLAEPVAELKVPGAQARQLEATDWENLPWAHETHTT